MLPSKLQLNRFSSFGTKCSEVVTNIHPVLVAKPVISDRWSVISAWPDFVKVRTKCRRSLCNITLDCVIRLTEVWTLYTKVKWSVVPSLHRMKSQEHEYGDTSNSSVIHNTTYCWILKSFDDLYSLLWWIMVKPPHRNGTFAP